MKRLDVAVIGSGISGLTAAWLLSSHHRVTLFEADNRIGGHANTVDVLMPDGPVPVDTGFIVFNERNYPNLTALFRHLKVKTEATEMSFALSMDTGAYEYAGSGISGFFGQKRNVTNLGHWQLFRDVSRFFRSARTQIERHSAGVTLGSFLAEEGYSDTFIRNHIVPMGAAIWSTDMAQMLEFPARSFIDFYANHGMMQFRGRPAWQTVSGGSRNYIEAIVAGGGFEIQRNVRVQRIVRRPNRVHISDNRGVTRPFDHTILATHADQALNLLDRPTAAETALLSRFSYQTNRAVLHRDARWMPKRKRLWSSWNYLRSGSEDGGNLCVTYWMNGLQNLKTGANLFITLNPGTEIHPKAVEADFEYRHPVFDEAAMQAQTALWNIQGQRRTWFCGSYFGYGFHEDGAQSGLAVAETLGQVRRPWTVANESGRIALPAPSTIKAAE